MAGLADLLGYANNPIYKAIQPMGGSLGAIGSGLLSGRNWTEGWKAAGTNLQNQARLEEEQRQFNEVKAQHDAKAAAQQQEINKTVEWMRNNGFEALASAAEASPSRIPELYKTALDQMYNTGAGAGGEDPASVREWAHYNSLTPEQKSEYLRMKRAVPYLNLGTDFAQPDPANPGQIAGAPIPINNEQAAFDTATGAGLGKVNAENIAAAGSMGSKLPGLKKVVEELGQLAETATYTQTGKLWDDIMRETGQMPSEGALARTKYMAMVDNQVLPLLRDTFGAAFTVQEGESLRATLGAPDKSPAEKKAVLEAFIEQKIRDVEAMQSRIPGGSGGNRTSTGVGWSYEP